MEPTAEKRLPVLYDLIECAKGAKIGPREAVVLIDDETETQLIQELANGEYEKWLPTLGYAFAEPIATFVAKVGHRPIFELLCPCAVLWDETQFAITPLSTLPSDKLIEVVHGLQRKNRLIHRTVAIAQAETP